MLAAHSQVFSLPETFFFAKVLPRSWIKRNLLWPAIKVRRHLPHLVHEMGRDDLLPLARIGFFQVDYHVPFVTIMDRMAMDAGKSLWVEKTPWHLYCIEEILRRIPDAVFLHIIRDGRDVVASLYNVTRNNPQAWANFSKWRWKQWKGFTIEQCVAMWNRDISITRKWAGNAGHMVVGYEDILAHPAGEGEKIAHFLGIGFETNMMQPSRTFEAIVRPEEGWKAQNANPIGRTERLYERVFSLTEQEWIEAHLDSYHV